MKQHEAQREGATCPRSQSQEGIGQFSVAELSDANSSCALGSLAWPCALTGNCLAALGDSFPVGFISPPNLELFLDSLWHSTRLGGHTAGAQCPLSFSGI